MGGAPLASPAVLLARISSCTELQCSEPPEVLLQLVTEVFFFSSIHLPSVVCETVTTTRDGWNRWASEVMAWVQVWAQVRSCEQSGPVCGFVFVSGLLCSLAEETALAHDALCFLPDVFFFFLFDRALPFYQQQSFCLLR